MIQTSLVIPQWRTSGRVYRKASAPVLISMPFKIGLWAIYFLSPISIVPHSTKTSQIYQIIIQGGAGHSSFLNTAGLRKAGCDVDNEPDVKDAKFGRRSDGSLTGELGELAMNKTMLVKGNPNMAHAKRAINEAINRLHRVGVTSCQDAATNTVILHALRELDRDNALKMDVAAHSVYAPEFLANERQDSLEALIDQAPGLATKHVRTSFVRILLDGVPLPPLFQVLE